MKSQKERSAEQQDNLLTVWKLMLLLLAIFAFSFTYIALRTTRLEAQGFDEPDRLKNAIPDLLMAIFPSLIAVSIVTALTLALFKMFKIPPFDTLENKKHSKEIAKIEKLINSGQATRTANRKDFHAKFDQKLNNYENSIHIVVLDETSIDAYEGNAVYNNREAWGNLPKEKRLRVVVLEKPDLIESREMKNLLNFFRETTVCKIVYKHYLDNSKFSHIQKDMGIFHGDNNGNSITGFITYFDGEKQIDRFKKAAATEFEIKCAKYLNNLKDDFYQMWADSEFIKEAEAGETLFGE